MSGRDAAVVAFSVLSIAAAFALVFGFTWSKWLASLPDFNADGWTKGQKFVRPEEEATEAVATEAVE